MEKFTVLWMVVLSLIILYDCQAQSDSVVPGKMYRTWIIPNEGFRGKSGILYGIKDSAVQVSNSPQKSDYSEGLYTVSEIDVRKIDEIKIRQKGIGFGILVGGLSGLIVGSVITYYFEKHLAETMNPLTFFFGGEMLGVFPIIISTGAGIGAGALMAGSKITIPIKGNQANFDRNKELLNDYALMKRKIVTDTLHLKAAHFPIEGSGDTSFQLNLPHGTYKCRMDKQVQPGYINVYRAVPNEGLILLAEQRIPEMKAGRDAQKDFEFTVTYDGPTMIVITSSSYWKGIIFRH
jgi:hypothetical protein